MTQDGFTADNGRCKRFSRKHRGEASLIEPLILYRLVGSFSVLFVVFRMRITARSKPSRGGEREADRTGAGAARA